MASHRLAAALMTACGLSAAATGWLISLPPPRTGDTGALPTGVHRAVTGDREESSPPVRVQGPAGLDAAVVPVAARPDGALNLPQDSRIGGWWALGAPAGAAAGTVLIAGHVDTRQGLGPFAALHETRVGARIAVTGADAEVRFYQVTARRTYSQQKLPPDLFTRTGSYRLVLITCAGPYNRASGGYEKNLVLYATPTGAPIT
ncbi:class F sortase [Streptomyces cinereoruber]|uniref:class F sortase n=1 Tax=Streptomyces cinereoruber TaxID=67260 RepID=UPI00363DA0DF